MSDRLSRSSLALWRGALLVCAVIAISLIAASGSAQAAPELDVSLADDASELQWVKLHATGGQFSLCFEASCTPDLGTGASGAAIQSALNALPSISSGGGSVAVTGAAGAAGEGFLVAFAGGPLAHTDVAQLVPANGTAPLVGGMGAKIVVRTLDPAGVSRNDERVDYTAIVKNGGSDPTSGQVVLVVEAPAGQQTSILAATGSGWSCERLAPSGGLAARTNCTRSDPLAPGASYPAVQVATALGADAPDEATATATASCLCATQDGAAADVFPFAPTRPFGIASAEGGLFKSDGQLPFGDPFTQAGGHPDNGVADYLFFTRRQLQAVNSSLPAGYRPTEYLRRLRADLPRGQVGNPLAVPELCSGVDVIGAFFNLSHCPEESVVGAVSIALAAEGVLHSPIYAIQPEFGTPAQFAFYAAGNIYVLSAHLRADDHYAVSLELEPSPKINLVLSEVTLCNFGTRISAGQVAGCKAPGDFDANPKPLFTNPTRCDPLEPPMINTLLDSWEHPGVFVEKAFTAAPIDGCGAVPFEPAATLAPTNHRADSPTGIDVEITMPTGGLESNDGIAQSNLDTAAVTFPKGMSINPASADGLEACSLDQIKLDSNAEDECPPSSKVGTVAITTPLLRNILTGSVYVAKQNDNPFHTTLGLYMVFSSARDGVTIKVAGRLVPDPNTGQLTTAFTENPEAPFSQLALHLNQGPRAPLINPPKCGTYAIHSEFSPWSAVDPANPSADEIVEEDSEFEIGEGPDGGPCPSGELEPKLNAGLTNPIAGAKSPFVLTLSRKDGSQRFTGLDIAAPKGLTAYLAGIPYCPDAVLAGISGAEEAGRAELASPSCPAASRVGTVLAGAGSGPFPFHTPGQVYLAGPYKGAPVSLAVVTPAVAGPFDLGNVVIRNGLYVNPETAQVTAISDPIPTILHGILLDLRQVRIALDRPGFTAAPTSCEPQQVIARVSGEQGGQALAAAPFGVSGCESLGFGPKLSLRLSGGTKRGGHPKLQAILQPRPGDANIAGASVALPHSEFLDQAHIRTICTRVQFAANACPAAAVYGQAEAVTPLLDSPLSGPVYLRSSDNPLPDLVAALRGPDNQPIEVVLRGRIDSIHGGIRTSFEAVPDQPVSSFVLKMQGGRKGLLVNSRDICKSTSRATAIFTAQNGRTVTLRPRLQNSCNKARKNGKQRKHKRHGGRRSAR
jgi:hypothetical protein